MFRYAQVENALLAMHTPDEVHRGAMRARLKYFQRLGLTENAPGKGARVQYSFEDVATWAFGLQLAEFGIDPTRIAAIKLVVWSDVRPYLLADHRGTHLCAFLPRMLSRDLIDDIEQSDHRNSGILPLDGGNSGFHIVFRSSDLDIAAPARALVINLTNLRQGLVNAIGETE